MALCCILKENMSVLSQKSVEEISPSADGRQRVVRQLTDREPLPHPRPLSRASGRGVPKAG
jgi:hypothetical protein